MCVCVFTGGFHETITHGPLISPYRDFSAPHRPHCTGIPLPKTCSNLFNLDLAVQKQPQPPSSRPDVLKLVHYKNAFQWDAYCLLEWPPGGCLPHTLSPLWTEFLTHACENITLPQTTLRTVIKHSTYGWQAGGSHPTGMLSCHQCSLTIDLEELHQ